MTRRTQSEQWAREMSKKFITSGEDVNLTFVEWCYLMGKRDALEEIMEQDDSQNAQKTL